MTTTTRKRRRTAPAVDLTAPATDEEVLAVSNDALDPYVDTCAPWCERAADGHVFVSRESDRVHYGSAAFVPVRSLRATYLSSSTTASDAVFELGHMGTNLRSPVLHSQPGLQLYINSRDIDIDGCSVLNITLTLDEAEQIFTAGLEQVRIARSA